MPGTVSSACIRFSGDRRASWRLERSVVAEPGEASMLGAAPTTVTDSSASALTLIVGAVSTAVMSTGLATWPPARTTTS